MTVNQELLSGKCFSNGVCEGLYHLVLMTRQSFPFYHFTYYIKFNHTHSAYAFYGALLTAKMLPMGFLTARQRFAKRVFTSPEDTQGRKEAKVRYDDPDVERVR